MVDVLGDGLSQLELLQYMGGEQAIVDRARKCYQSQDKQTAESDRRLLGLLMNPGPKQPLHGTTLRGTVFTFDVVAPLFVIRQWTRHIVGHDASGSDLWSTGGDTFDIGSAYDEQSFRYTGKNLRYYVPQNVTEAQRHVWVSMMEAQKTRYGYLRDLGFDKQLARCALGPAFYSQMEWTCNLHGFLNWYEKRMPGSGAQPEIVKYAEAAYQLIEAVVPNALAAWRTGLNA